MSTRRWEGEGAKSWVAIAWSNRCKRMQIHANCGRISICMQTYVTLYAGMQADLVTLNIWLLNSVMYKASYLLPKTSMKLCLAPLSKGQAPVAFLRFSYISIVVMFLAIMRQCMIRKPTMASAKAASMTKARNRIAGLQHSQLCLGTHTYSQRCCACLHRP